MADQSTSPDPAAPDVKVVEREIPDETWQDIGLDLAALRVEADEARRRWNASVSTTRSWATAHIADEPEHRPADEAAVKSDPPKEEPRRVPEKDIIVIGRTPPASPPKKGLWRELFFLGVLAVTLFGAFYSGRLNAYQRVIVVPIPESRHSVIT